MPPLVTVVGAGVSGLTTAICLQERGYRVRIVARQGSPYTTSDVPAALWYPYKAEPREQVLQLAARSHRRFQDIARTDERAGVRLLPGVEVFPYPVPDPDWKDAVTAYRRARPDELPAGTVDGYRFEAPVIEVPLYMPWLRTRFLAAGGEQVDREVRELDTLTPRGSITVNCTGLGSRELLLDRELFPSRGQLVHLEPRPLSSFYLDEARPDGITYIVPRRDAIVLGGSVGDGDESLAVDSVLTRDIVARACRLLPELTGARVLRSVVGIRPCRTALRLAAERLPTGGLLAHNYGHGGAGFTLSWGAAEAACRLVEELAGD